MRTPLIAFFILISCALANGQSKPAQTSKKDTVTVQAPAAADTVVSRTELLRYLETRSETLRKDAEAALIRISGMHDAFAVQKDDSVKVSKQLFK